MKISFDRILSQSNTVISRTHTLLKVYLFIVHYKIKYNMYVIYNMYIVHFVANTAIDSFDAIKNTCHLKKIFTIIIIYKKKKNRHNRLV